MLAIKNLEKVYKNSKGKEICAVNNVSTAFGDMGLVFVLGKSGSGKTTLLNLLCGMDRPTAGKIFFNGKSIDELNRDELDAFRNRFVGLVFQQYNLISEYTVGQNVGLALELQGEVADREAVDKVLTDVDLINSSGETFYERKIGELSGGEKQRVAVARALVKNPKIILADEPTGALDKDKGENLYRLLKALSKERLVIVVTHDIEQAKKYGDRIIEMSDGNIVSDTDIENDIKDEPVKTETEEKDSKRYSLSLKRCFSLGASSLRHKKARLVVSILLCVFASFLMSFSVTVATCNKVNTHLSILYDKKIDYAIVESDSYYWWMFPSGNIEKLEIDAIEALQYKAMKDFYGDVLPVSKLVRTDYWNHIPKEVREEKLDLGGLQDYNPYISLITHGRSYYVELSSSQAEKFGIYPDPRLKNKNLCRLPQSLNEIAISDARADIYLKFGYCDENENLFTISSPDDLIGKKLGDFTICGVYSTPESRLDLQKEFDKTYSSRWQVCLDYETRMFLSDNHHIATYAFLYDGYSVESGQMGMNDFLYEYLVKLKGKRFVDRAFFGRGDVKYSNKDRDGKPCHYALNIASPYSSIIDESLRIFSDYRFLAIVRAVAIVFAFISYLNIRNYLSINIDFRKRELGILRAIGASKRDVNRICLFESLIIATCIFVLSLLSTIITSGIMNAFYHVPIFIVGFFPVLALLLLCFGVSALATLLPLKKLAKLNPVEIVE